MTGRNTAALFLAGAHLLEYRGLAIVEVLPFFNELTDENVIIKINVVTMMIIMLVVVVIVVAVVLMMMMKMMIMKNKMKMMMIMHSGHVPCVTLQVNVPYASFARVCVRVRV